MKRFSRSCSQPSRLRAGPSSPDDHQVFAEAFHALVLIYAETLAQTYQDDHGRDSPHNSKHGEECAHLVGPEGGEGLSQDVEEVHGRTLEWLETRAGGLCGLYK